MTNNLSCITSDYRAQVIADVFFDPAHMRNLAGDSDEARKAQLVKMIKTEMDCHLAANV